MAFSEDATNCFTMNHVVKRDGVRVFLIRRKVGYEAHSGYNQKPMR